MRQLEVPSAPLSFLAPEFVDAADSFEILTDAMVGLKQEVANDQIG
jgi:hypothetical protein